MNRFPHVAAAVPKVTAQLRAVHTQKTPATCEVEARLGRTVTDEATGRRYFRTGVDEGFVAKLLCVLATSDAFSVQTPWIQSVDRFYLLPSGLQVRTTTTVPYVEGQDVIAKPPKYDVTHMIKTGISSGTYVWDGAEGGDAPPPYEVRVSVKNEEPVFATELQERVDELDLVRVKHRKTFGYTPKGEDKPVWNIDVTMVWQRPSHLEAMAALQAGEPPTYEVEVECTRPAEFIRRRGCETVALSLLLKVADLFTVTKTIGPDPALLPI